MIETLEQSQERVLWSYVDRRKTGRDRPTRILNHNLHTCVDHEQSNVFQPDTSKQLQD